MRKENVFLVAVRQVDRAGHPAGKAVNYVVCGLDEASVRNHLAVSLPNFAILSAVNLKTLEGVVKKLKDSVDGNGDTNVISQ